MLRYQLAASCRSVTCEVVLLHLLPKKRAVCFEEGLARVRGNSARLWKPQQILGSSGAAEQDWMADAMMLRGPSSR